ncbi:putative mitochondrial protein, partial [Mucuna pruriens]
MKELGKLKYFLGIKVAYSKQGIFISQRKYILDLLKEIEKLGCKISRVLIEQNHKIGYEESPIIEKSQYQRLMGKLIYLSHTRLDIAYDVSVISQFMHDPRERHLQAIAHENIYKKEGTLSMKIYTDANYAGSVVDRRSTSGYSMFLGGNLVTWRSKKSIYEKKNLNKDQKVVIKNIFKLLYLFLVITIKEYNEKSKTHHTRWF